MRLNLPDPIYIFRHVAPIFTPSSHPAPASRESYFLRERIAGESRNRDCDGDGDGDGVGDSDDVASYSDTGRVFCTASIGSPWLWWWWCEKDDRCEDDVD